jgi:hypothetical protein
MSRFLAVPAAVYVANGREVTAISVLVINVVGMRIKHAHVLLCVRPDHLAAAWPRSVQGGIPCCLPGYPKRYANSWAANEVQVGVTSNFRFQELLESFLLYC